MNASFWKGGTFRFADYKILIIKPVAKVQRHSRATTKKFIFFMLQ